MRPVARSAAIAAAALLACASGAQRPITESPPPDAPVATRHPYEMDGRVQSVAGGLLGMGRSITVAREEAPPAVIHVADETRVSIDGRASGLAYLRPGDDVRVVFDFDRDTPVALRIDARPHR